MPTRTVLIQTVTVHQSKESCNENHYQVFQAILLPADPVQLADNQPQPGPGAALRSGGTPQQQSGTDETSQQPPSGGPVQPAKTSPWARLPDKAPAGSPPGGGTPDIQVDPDKVYLAATWTEDAVHFLDAEMNETGSFPSGASDPNGVAADGWTIYTMHHISQTVRIFDYEGNFLDSWSDSRLEAAQGLELVGSELAFYDNAAIQVHFFTPYGAYLRSIPGHYSAEGLAYDGTLLWQLADVTLYGANPADGTVIKTIPNPGSGCQYGATGLTANAPGELTVACTSGDWYRLSTADGSLLDSGNNGLDMYGLASSAAIRMYPVYIRSTVGSPWNSTSNEAIMDSVFGADYWEDLRYEEVDPYNLFSGYHNLIYMEGSDTNADELEAFLATNQTLLEEWVGYGGCLLLNAAPNEGDGMSFGFDGVTLTYPGFVSTTMAVDASHPIFNGPFTPITTTFSGLYFAHASLSGGEVSDVLTSADGSIPLAEKDWGNGHAAFGGMSYTDAHIPQPEATNLRANLLYYLTTFGCQVNYPIAARDDGRLFFEDFENGYDDWTMDGLWNPESQADSCGAMVAPFPSPNNAAYYGVSETCTYSTTLYSGTLTLNLPIAMPEDSAPLLTFHSYEQTENVCETWDFRVVQISADGGITWDTLGNLCTENTWYRPSFDLSAYAGQQVLLRFLFDTIDSSYDIFFGWMVDNISIGFPGSFFGTPLFVTQADSPYVTPNVLDNDFDPMYDELSVVSFDGSGMIGTLASNGDGTFTYDPQGALDYLNEGEQVLETFSYVSGDGVYTDTAQVYILVVGVDDPPVAGDDFYSTRNDRTLTVDAPGVMVNDYDPEGEPVTAYLGADPSVGILSFLSDGAFAYIPPLDYVGDTAFTYLVTDGYYWSNNVSQKVSFAEPEFPLDTPVDGFVVSSLFGEPVPPISFNFELSGTPSISATFTENGPGYTAFNAMPNIEGPTQGTLTIDLGTYVFDASFGFVLDCSGYLTDAITVTAYTEDMTPLGTLYFDGGDTGSGYPENLAPVNVGGTFRILEIDFNDACFAFVVDNLWYFTSSEATPATIAITPSEFWTFLPMMAKQ